MCGLQKADCRYDMWGTHVLTSDGHSHGSPVLEQYPLHRGIDKGLAARVFNDGHHVERDLKERERDLCKINAFNDSKGITVSNKV